MHQTDNGITQTYQVENVVLIEQQILIANLKEMCSS